MTIEEIFKKMQELVAEQFAADVEEVTMETSFEEDLGADSVDLVELVMAMEEEFEVGEIEEEDLFSSLAEIRTKVGDRAVLRALHFFAENARVERQKELLLTDCFEEFLSEVIASGRSSFCYLQNVYASKNPSEQGISLALCLAESMLASCGGAWRVHGGGFAGTIQAYVPTDVLDAFCAQMNAVFGKGSCTVLCIRSESAKRIL